MMQIIFAVIEDDGDYDSSRGCDGEVFVGCNKAVVKVVVIVIMLW